MDIENDDLPPDDSNVGASDSPQESAPLEADEIFGNYKITKCLSAGLIAQYYRAQHVRDSHEVTIAVFHERASDEPDFLDRLKTLQGTLEVFDNKSFPKIRDIAMISGRICLFFDPFEGRSLSEVFAAEAKAGESGVGLKRASKTMASMLGALGYAHSQGLDHRDLDSDLVYLRNDGSIRIFGIGIKATLGAPLFESIVSASVSPLESTKTLGQLNSFDVMSPEYRSGEKEAPRVDIYGVGYIGYWLLTGQKAHATGFAAPSDHVKGLSPHWNHFFESALHREPGDRYQSCKQALSGLRDTEEELFSEAASQIKRQIARIPVPKKIEERGELASRIYRLFLSGLGGLALTGLAAVFLSVVYTNDEDPPFRVAELVDAKEEAQVCITLKPPVAEVEFVGHDDRFVANDGKLFLNVRPGRFTLQVTAPDHVEKVVRLSVDPESVESKVLTVKLDEVITQVVLTTEPGASIMMVDSRGVEIRAGEADDLGVFALDKDALEGNQEVFIKKEGFRPKVLAIQALDGNEVESVEALLEPLPATLVVSTLPEGASVIINGVFSGVTPLVFGDVVPDDEYRVVAQLEGYRPVERSVQVGPGDELEIAFGELDSLSGSVGIEYAVAGIGVASLKGFDASVEVLIDGHGYPLGDPALESIPAGKHTMQLVHPLYTSKETEVLIEDGQIQRLTFVLNPLPGQVILKLPVGLKSTVLINGEPVDVADGLLELPAFKSIELELQIPNHLTMRRSFKLNPDQKVLWNVEPTLIPGPIEGQRWILPYQGISFEWVPKGGFLMGSSREEHARLPNEGPQTPVQFTRGYWVGTYEVTQAQYQRVMEKNPSMFQSDQHPVERVSWEAAKTFCNELNAIEAEAGRLPQGYAYRLPTEPEWEYAARGGTATPFHFGDEADATSGRFNGVYPRTRQDGVRASTGYGTQTVGRSPANAYGLFDIHGNVREWTLDRYTGRLNEERLVDPKPLTDGTRIAVRGGGWADTAARVRIAAREDFNPLTESEAIGFRVVLAPDR